MTPARAANKIRDKINFDEIAVETRHHVAYLEDLARALGVEPSVLNISVIAEALAKEKISAPDNEFPKMLFSRVEPKEGTAATYLSRHKCWITTIESADDQKALGGDWVESVEDLPEIKTKAE